MASESVSTPKILIVVEVHYYFILPNLGASILMPSVLIPALLAPKAINVVLAWKIQDLRNNPFLMSFSKCWQLCDDENTTGTCWTNIHFVRWLACIWIKSSDSFCLYNICKTCTVPFCCCTVNLVYASLLCCTLLKHCCVVNTDVAGHGAVTAGGEGAGTVVLKAEFDYKRADSELFIEI